MFPSSSTTGRFSSSLTGCPRSDSDRFSVQGSDELILLYGDTDGCVNILIFLAAREIFRLLTTLERRKGIPTVSFDRFLDSYKCDYIRWQVHREWIGEWLRGREGSWSDRSRLEHIYFDDRLNQIISSSNDQQTAVVIGCIRASASSEIQLTETGFTESKTSRIKSADPKVSSNRRRGTMSSGNCLSEDSRWSDGVSLLDYNDDTTLPSMAHTRSKRDSTTSFLTQSSSQDNHSKKALGNDHRSDGFAPGGTTGRPAIVRHQPIIRAPQIRCDTDQTVFKIHKGAKTFDMCTAKNVLVTGGMDRVIRLWNPYLPSRPVARLRGHNAPVFLVKIAMEDDRLFSISTDKTVLVSEEREKSLSMENNVFF